MRSDTNKANSMANEAQTVRALKNVIPKTSPKTGAYPAGDTNLAKIIKPIPRRRGSIRNVFVCIDVTFSANMSLKRSWQK